MKGRMTKQSPENIKQRPTLHADDTTAQHSAEVRQALDAIELEYVPFEFNKWIVLGIMLLLLMLPVVYLFVVDSMPQRPASSGVSTASVSTRRSAAEVPPGPIPAPAEAPRAAAGFTDLELAATMTAADATPTSSTAKPDSERKARPISGVSAMISKSAFKAYKEKGRAKDADDSAEKSAEIQPEPHTVADFSTMQSEKPAEFCRDIVVPAPGELTESLVKRCRRLGLIEGELCRVRICSGIWGRDPACPEEGHASVN
jgi:hypothetical protein